MFEKLVNLGNKLPIPFGYNYKIINYIIALDKGTVIPLEENTKYVCPTIIRTKGSSPHFLADYAKYFFDYPKHKKCKESMFRMIKEFDEKFPEENLYNRMLETLEKIDASDLGIIKDKDVILFAEVIDKNNYTLFTNKDNVKNFWKDYIKLKCNSNIIGQCMYCLERKNLISKIPKKSSNIDLVNNNLVVSKSYIHYNEKHIFPICVDCIDKIFSAISFLMNRKSNSFYYFFDKNSKSNFLAIFWYDNENLDEDIDEEQYLSKFFNCSRSDNAKTSLKSYSKNKYLDLNQNEFNIIMIEQKYKGPARILSYPNFSCSYNEIFNNLKKYKMNNPYSLKRFVDYFTKDYKGKLPLISNDKEKNNLIRDLINFALFGISLPEKYLYKIIGRCKRNSKVNRIEEVILKMYERKDQSKKAYMFGELFWEFENLQYQAVGKLNRGISGQFFRPVLINPEEIFVKLILKSKDYLEILTNKDIKKKNYLQKIIDNLVNSIGELPEIFSIHEQASFCCGYCSRRCIYFDNLNKKGVK